MQIKIDFSGMPEVQTALKEMPKKATYAAARAVNTSLEWGETFVRKEMRKVFDRPTPWVLQSLRKHYATASNMNASLGFKDKWSTSAGEVSGRTMIEPHVYSGERKFKGMEVRLNRAGWLPNGYNAVPGGGATLDGYGNMSAGQITQVLNVLGTYTEGGYNTANSKTVTRLKKGNIKKNIYGFVYWVNRVGSGISHIPPGVYKRVYTGFGTSLVPILIFVKRAKYTERLDFYGIAQREFNNRFPAEFDKAFAAEMAKTAPPMLG